MAVDHLTRRVVNQVRDKWGRWTIQEVKGRDDSKVIIVSVYQPIDNTSGVGKTTVAAQQKSLLILSQNSTTNPRTAFRRDLLATLKAYRHRNTSFLIVGDFNEQFGADPDGIVKIAESMELLDLMASRHSSTPLATYARGTKRLDSAIASPHICDALCFSGYEEFNSRIASDHRGYYF